MVCPGRLGTFLPSFPWCPGTYRRVTLFNEPKSFEANLQSLTELRSTISNMRTKIAGSLSEQISIYFPFNVLMDTEQQHRDIEKISAWKNAANIANGQHIVMTIPLQYIPAPQMVFSIPQSLCLVFKLHNYLWRRMVVIFEEFNYFTHSFCVSIQDVLNYNGDHWTTDRN